MKRVKALEAAKGDVAALEGKLAAAQSSEDASGARVVRFAAA